MASLGRSLAPVGAVAGASAILILSFDPGVAALVGDQNSGGVGAAGSVGSGGQPAPAAQLPGGPAGRQGDGNDDEHDDEHDGPGRSFGDAGGAAAGGAAGGAGSAGGMAGDASSGAGTCTGQEVTGPVVNTQFGPVQVAAKVAGGKVCAVRTLQSPSFDHESISINAQAIPMLDQQAVQAGDASFAGVSGATYTTDGYRQSLQAVLDQAK